MRKRHGVVIAMVAVVVIGCGPNASSTPSAAGLAASPDAGAMAPPAWDSFEVGELQFDGPFDNPYGKVESGVPVGDGFVLVGGSRDENDRQHGAVWTSPDGGTWTRYPDPDGTFDATHLAHVATDGRHIVALDTPTGLNGVRAANVVWTSEDGGATWVRHDLGSTELGAIDPTGIVGSPTGAGFVAWGTPPEDRRTRLLWSPDGLEWQRLDYPGADDDDITSVVAFRAGFVAVGGGHWDGSIPPQEPARAWFSTDGRTWQAANVPGGERTLRGVYATMGGVYAVGQSHLGGVTPYVTWHSVDGATWRILGNEPAHGRMTASNGNQVARFAWQDDRSISLSNDGVEWRPSAANIPAVDWDGGMVFGRNGILLLVALTPVEADVEHVHSGVLFLRGVSSGSG